jgi:hypothetical protein
VSANRHLEEMIQMADKRRANRPRSERPLLFSAPMVRALLDGRKTQTRRIEKGDVEEVDEPEWYGSRCLVHKPRCQRAFCETIEDFELACGGYDCDAQGRTERSPYGGPGDKLWVKETWAGEVGDEVEYRADNPDPTGGRWKPSIFMPRKASRITLEITAVRLERLQEISEEDAIAEGVERNVDDGVTYWGPLGKGHVDPRVAYRWIWEDINGPRSWAANPWVWVISFPRCAS